MTTAATDKKRSTTMDHSPNGLHTAENIATGYVPFARESLLGARVSADEPASSNHASCDVVAGWIVGADIASSDLVQRPVTAAMNGVWPTQARLPKREALQSVIAPQRNAPLA